MAPGLHVMACDALVGAPVVDRANEEIATLAHVMLDIASGRVAYAVLAHGGVLGVGEKLFTVPWEALTLDPSRDRFILDNGL